MRPAYFGEVVFPPSRAVDVDFGDDFDEDVPSRSKIIIETKNDVSKVVASLKYLVIACGFHPSNFAKVHLITDQPKSEIIFNVKVYSPIKSDSEAENRLSLPISSLDFYYVPSTNSLVGVTTSKYAPTTDVANGVVAKIFEQLAKAASTVRVFIFDFKPAALYQSINRASVENRLSTMGIVRVLMSSKEKAANTDNLHQLEIPNMMDGLSASVMTHCELNGIRAIIHVLYGSDSSDAISTNVNAYHASLANAVIWKSEFFLQENASIHKSKLDAIIRQSAPVGSMFG
jgi:hypothetical protein